MCYMAEYNLAINGHITHFKFGLIPTMWNI